MSKTVGRVEYPIFYLNGTFLHRMFNAILYLEDLEEKEGGVICSQKQSYASASVLHDNLVDLRFMVTALLGTTGDMGGNEADDP